MANLNFGKAKPTAKDLAAETDKPDAKTVLDQETKRLESVERTQIYGAPSLQPKQRLLDASDVQENHPDKHLRWVNIANQEKADARTQTEGYQSLPDDEGGRQLGDRLKLMWIPKDQADAKRKRIDAESERRMEAHKGEMQRAVEGVARQLRDKHNLDVDVNRLFVDE